MCPIQVDIQTTLKNLFPQDFYIHSQSTTVQCSSSLWLSIPGTSSPTFLKPFPHEQNSIPSNFFTPEGDHEANSRSISPRVLFTPSSSTPQHHQPHQNFPNYASITHPEDTASKRSYRPDINPNITPHMLGFNFHTQSLHSRSFGFFRNLNLTRMRESNQATRPIISTQHYHTISERRRGKLNENFQALRALLPPGTKVHIYQTTFQHFSCNLISNAMLIAFWYVLLLFYYKNKCLMADRPVGVKFIHLLLYFLSNCSIILIIYYYENRE